MVENIRYKTFRYYVFRALPQGKVWEKRIGVLITHCMFSTAEKRFLFLSRPESMMQNYFL